METLENLADIIIAKRRLIRPVRKNYPADIDYLMKLIVEIGKKMAKGFVIDDENHFAYENILKWLVGHPFGCVDPNTGNVMQGNHYKGIYLGGNCGSGKSMLLTIIAAIGNHFNVTYEFDGEDIPLTWGDVRTDELCSEFILQGADVVQKAKNANVLCLNDFGSEPVEQLYMGNRMNVIRQIIESRADKLGQFTLISSNIPMGDNLMIKERYGDRVESRLKQMCNYFILAGTDRRK